MKVLITTDLFTTATNGVVTSVRNLSDELERRGHDVRILTLSASLKSYQDRTVYYIRSMPVGVYPNVRMPLSYRHDLIDELIAWKPDVIHSQCELFSMQYAKRISKLTGAPIVHTYHTMYEQYIGYVLPGKRLGNWAVRVLAHRRLEKVSLVIVPTAKMEAVLTGYGLKKPIRVIPSGIALEQHRQRLLPDARHAKRAALGISDEQTVLISLGRLGAEKNLDELLHLFAKACAIHEGLVFLIVGDGPARSQLVCTARRLGVESQVVFAGMVDPSEVQEYYQLGDVFVSASTSETQGLTYIEAAANGLPLLCRQDSCLADVIEQGENGFEYACEQEFLDALAVISNDPGWRASAGKRSEIIAAKFDKATFGNAIEEVYESVLEDRLEK